MKIRFYPKAEVVRGILQEELNHSERLVNDANTSMGKLQDKAIFETDDSSEEYAKAIAANKRSLEAARAMILAFDSHSPSEVMAEIEL